MIAAGEQTKRCPRCGETKSFSEFSKDRHNKHGLQSKCKACQASYQREHREESNERTRRWAKNNPEKRKEAQRKYDRANPDKAMAKHLRRKFGITLDEYNRLLEKQGGVCAICGASPQNRNLSVDHDHATGKVRGLLCVNCNSAMGQAGDDPARLQKMIEYLLAPQGEE